MHKHLPPPRLLMTQLVERYYDEAPRRPVVCCLWRLCPVPPVEGSAVYAIGMESPTKRYLYCVGSDGEAALRLWENITQGKLSPVHLGDVVEDFLWETGQGRKAAAETAAELMTETPV